jgi:hypothetical protein
MPAPLGMTLRLFGDQTIRAQLFFGRSATLGLTDVLACGGALPLWIKDELSCDESPLVNLTPARCDSKLAI